MDREKVLVLGAGRSGIAAAKQILGLGGQVVLFDSNEKLNVAELLKNFEKKDKIRILKGKLSPTDLVNVDLAVISPGIPLDLPLVKRIRGAKIPIWGELELAYQSSRGKLRDHRDQWEDDDGLPGGRDSSLPFQ